MGFLYFLIGPLQLYSHSSFDASSFLGLSWPKTFGNCTKRSGTRPRHRLCAPVGMDGSGKEQGCLSSPWVPQHQYDSPSLWGCVRKGPLFLGRGERGGRQRDSRGWPALLWKENERRENRLFLAPLGFPPLSLSTQVLRRQDASLTSVPKSKLCFEIKRKGNGQLPHPPDGPTQTLHLPSPRPGPERETGQAGLSPPPMVISSFFRFGGDIPTSTPTH